MSSSPFNQGSTIPLWRNGEQIVSEQVLEIVSPANEKVLYKTSCASESDALAAVEAAEKALPKWKNTKPAERRDLFLRAAVEFERRSDELRQYSQTETGSSDQIFKFESAAALETLKSHAGLITSLAGTVPTVAEEGSSAMVVREPYGVVVGIAPWNAPYALGIRAFLGPLAMGNTVVLKGPERAPACYWALADIFHKVGLPAGCLNTIIHHPKDGPAVVSALISAPAVKKINFTGSTAVGSSIASIAGKHLKPVLMELGGKAPAIVCEDADVQKAALQCALGAFIHAGQICMSTERILVNEKILEPFKNALNATIDKVFSHESGLVLVDKLPVEKNKKMLEDALSKGAKTVYGDAAASCALSTAMRPVVVEGVQKGMDLYYTESFGPTVSLFAVKDDEEAIRIANDTDYGLSSAVYTEDLRRGLRIAKQIETGAVHINSMSVHDESSLPHGGAKKSGFGRFNGEEGLREWVRWKTITWKD